MIIRRILLSVFLWSTSIKTSLPKMTYDGMEIPDGDIARVGACLLLAKGKYKDEEAEYNFFLGSKLKDKMTN